MALVLLGGGITDLRGSIGGTTFARNAGGNYARARVKPVNPRASRQASRRANVAHITEYWSKTLVEAERLSWRTYAAGTTWTNRLGQSISINGLAAFLRTNALLLAIGHAIQDTAPILLGQSGAIDFTASASVAANQLSIDSIAAPWSNATDDDTAIFTMSVPMNPGVETAHKGFRICINIIGNTAAPPAAPYTAGPEYTLTLGQKFAVESRHLDELGRVSAKTRLPVTIVA